MMLLLLQPYRNVPFRSPSKHKLYRLQRKRETSESELEVEKAAREMASKEALAKGEEMLSLAYRASEQVI